MLCFNTERMIAKTEMSIVDGKLMGSCVQLGSLDLLNLRPCTGLETSFKFFRKVDEDTEICHICITHKRNRFEVSYGTQEEFRGQGYMKEALAYLIEWIFDNTNEEEIWGLPNGPDSEHILVASGFDYYGPVENAPSMKWYRIAKP